MKTKFYFGLLAAAALTMTACSSEDQPNNDPDNGSVQDGERYVAVSIRNVGGIGSRAEVYEEGVGNESNITKDNIRFYFFTADGRPFVMNQNGVNGSVSETNMVAPQEIASEETDGGAIETLKAKLVLGTPTEAYKGNRPAYVFCVANPTSSFAFTNFANKRISEIYNIFGNAPTTLDADDTFVMTSSTYGDASITNNPLQTGSKVVFFTDLEGKIFDKPDDAIGNPADIYLERLAAKVRVKGLGTYLIKEKQEDGTLVDATFAIKTLVNGAITTTTGNRLDVELTGWKLRNTAKTAYGIKHINNDWMTNAPFAGWNITDLHRSFWGTSHVASANDIENISYDIYNASQFALKNYDDSSNDNKKLNIAYCYENNMVQPSSISDRPTDATAIVVRGVVKMNGSDEGLALCYWGGDYYTEEALKEQFIQTYNADKNEGDKLTRDAVHFAKYTQQGAKSNTWYAYVQVGENQVHNNYRFANIKRWNNEDGTSVGTTSYYVNIAHMGGLYGVIRNHIYDYTFENVVGLGVPGNDPKNPDPETDTYLAARVYVLNWHVVSNNVVLE